MSDLYQPDETFRNKAHLKSLDEYRRWMDEQMRSAAPTADGDSEA